MGTLKLDVGGLRFDGGSDGKSWISKDGLDGWWDSPEVLFEETTDPGADGALDPAIVTVGPKRVNVTIDVDASSPQWSARNVRTWAASLAKMTDLSFRVYEEGIGWLSLRNAKVRGVVKVKPNRNDMRLTNIAFTAWSADPRKYSQTKRLPIDAVSPHVGGLDFDIAPEAGMDFDPGGVVTFPGVFWLPNEGTADYYPVFTVVGPMASFTITSESNVIAYDASIPVGSELILSPYAGGRAVLDGADVSHNLVAADWVAVQGEETRGYLFTPESPGAGAQLFIDYPEKGAFW